MTRAGLLAALLVSGSLALPGAGAAVAATTPATAGNALIYEQPLSPQAVQQVQEKLHALGLYRGGADGVWGGDSRAALERFQQSRGLQVTGQLNEATVATLGLNAGNLVGLSQAYSGSSTPPATSVSRPLRPEVVRMIQSRLGRLGFYSGNIDGVWGNRTETALQNFQQSRGLQVTGQLNPATVSAMGFNPDNLTQSGTSG